MLDLLAEYRLANSKDISMSFATTKSIEGINARNKDLIQEVLTLYPEKTTKRRAKHLNVYGAGRSVSGVKSNLKSILGVMTIGGCAYADSKSVVWRPIKDMLHISYGPVRCGQYSWGRGATITPARLYRYVRDIPVYVRIPEKDIVFGGNKKLVKLIDELRKEKGEIAAQQNLLSTEPPRLPPRAKKERK
ncbi:hypothetical protein A5906_01920 [Bradyrhizobium sacchari]|nr:hypothetical protein A5906_01920 [Bradyrhizobium sacchari]